MLDLFYEKVIFWCCFCVRFRRHQQCSGREDVWYPSERHPRSRLCHIVYCAKWYQNQGQFDGLVWFLLYFTQFHYILNFYLFFFQIGVLDYFEFFLHWLYDKIFHTGEGCQIWIQSWSVWNHMGKICDFLWSDFSMFLILKQEIWS